MARRTCAGKTKAGKKCGAPALKDKKLCFAHDDPEANARALEKAHVAYAALTPEQRKRKPRELDILAQRLNEAADEVVETLMHLALNAEKAVVVSGSRDEPGHVEMVPDDDLRLKAINALFDRVHGKPAQGIKLSGDPEGEPIRIAPERSEERAARVARILQQQGAIPTTARAA